MVEYTPKASCPIMLHFHCVSVKVCDKKATGNSVPLCSCESCALQASSEVSVYTMYFLVGFG